MGKLLKFLSAAVLNCNGKTAEGRRHRTTKAYQELPSSGLTISVPERLQ